MKQVMEVQNIYHP